MHRARSWRRFLNAFGERLGARPGFFLAHLLALYLLATALRAAHRVFWYDELLTLYISRLPRLADVFAVLREGLDLNPPLQYVAARISLGAGIPDMLALRLPVILSMGAMSLALYAFLRRRVPASYAMAGMMLPWLTDAYFNATNARPYALVLGGAAAALFCWLCWSRACEPGRRRGGWSVSP